jgi:hypothetical protein
MKSSNGSPMFSRFVVFALCVSLVSVQTLFAAGTSSWGTASAEIAVTGQGQSSEKPFVVVNGENAFTGRTFFSDGNISTTSTSSATLSLGKLGRVELAPSSSIQLSFSDGKIVGNLSNGTVSIASAQGVAVKINTPHDSVVSEGTAAGRFMVSVLGDQTEVAVKSGTVRYKNGAATLSKQDDDDDDDDDDNWLIWGTLALVGAAVVVVVLLNNDDDEDSISPVT